jgi:hypothetical protein
MKAAGRMEGARGKFVAAMLVASVALVSGWASAAPAEGARAKSDKKKLYISTIKSQDLPDTYGKLVRERISLAIFDKYGTTYRLVTDDDIKVMYKQAEKMMAQGCNAETCMTQIADAISADEIIYGEIRKDGDKVRLVLDNLMRDPVSLHLNKKSMVHIAFSEKLIEYFVGEASMKLMDPEYRIVEKDAPQMGPVQMLDVEVFKFSTTDETTGQILDFLKEKVREGDRQFDRKAYTDALEIYNQVMERIRNKLSEENRVKLAVFIEGVNKRLDQCHEMIASEFDEMGNAAYREYDFSGAIGNFSKGREAAEMIQDQARRYELTVKLAQKVENTRQTGTNYLANKVGSLLAQAEYCNLTDKESEALGHLNSARDLIMESPFINLQVVADFNKIAKMTSATLGDHRIAFYVDAAGAVVVNDSSFSMAEAFTAALSWCQKNGRFGLIDVNTGRIVVEPSYTSYREKCEGLAAVETGGKWGFINEYGALAIQPQFDTVTMGFNGGFAQVEVANTRYAVDLMGQRFRIPASSCEDDGTGQIKCGYLGENGEPVIQRMYDEARDFKGGYAAVRMNGKWGLVSVYGQLAVQCQYDSVSDFAEGLAVVSLNGKFGYINPQGMQTIPLLYENANDFTGGVAEVVRNGQTIFIDTTGMERKDTGR